MISCYLAQTFSGDGTHRNGISTVGLILAAAILFRLTAWGIPPTLSDDIYRYRWEGRLQAAGGNPYQEVPNDPKWQSLRDSAFVRVAGKDFKGGYGPLAEQLELITYNVVDKLTHDPASQIRWFRLPSAMADLGILAVLLVLLKTKHIAPERVLLYAWCPLPILEFWSAGHNDVLAVFFVALCLLAVSSDRQVLAILALFLAISVKWWPIVLLPALLFRRTRHPWRDSLAGCGAGVVLLLILSFKYWSDVSYNVDFMTGFLGGWRNNDSLFGLVRWLSGGERVAKYVTLGLVGTAALAFSCTRWPLERKMLATVAAMLALSANVHPWYLTWLFPLLVLEFQPALMLFVLLCPVFYGNITEWYALGQWRAVTADRWLVYVPVYGYALASIALKAVAGQRRSPKTGTTGIDPA